MRVLDSQQMREADRRTIQDLGVPSLVLMENAGREVVRAIEAEYGPEATTRVSVLCGRGNNGGDGFVVARLLADKGLHPRVWLAARAADVKGDAHTNLLALEALGVPVVEVADADAWSREAPRALDADLIVDALFGTGLNAPLTGVPAAMVQAVNAAAVPVVAIDLPSGLSGDRAELAGPAMRAALTVTLGAPKIPLVSAPAESYAGKVVIAEIGIPRAVMESAAGPRIDLLTADDVRPLIARRAADGHKGTYGHVLVVAGSIGKTGAASLAAMAALRSGAGLVTVATPRSCAAIVASLGAEYMTLALPEDGTGMVAERALEDILGFQADVIAAGPGLGHSASVAALVQGLVERSTSPLVLDADALNALAGRTDLLARPRAFDIVITPHPGEMARLCGTTTAVVQARRIETAREFAARHHAYVVLKGHGTIVADPDGSVAINTTGNPGMATGGTGDVLTGMIGAWLGQMKHAGRAARLAVFLHGLAGDLAAADLSEVALIARDVVARLGDAVCDVTARAAAAGPAAPAAQG